MIFLLDWTRFWRNIRLILMESFQQIRKVEFYYRFPAHHLDPFWGLVSALTPNFIFYQNRSHSPHKGATKREPMQNVWNTKQYLDVASRVNWKFTTIWKTASAPANFRSDKTYKISSVHFHNMHAKFQTTFARQKRGGTERQERMSFSSSALSKSLPVFKCQRKKNCMNKIKKCGL